MSANSIQKKIDHAHRKIGKTLGYDYNSFRPLNAVDVLHDENLIDTIKATFTLNDNYTKALNWDTPVWNVYTDAEQLQVGDFLWSEELNRTFFILVRQPHLPVLGLECPERVDLYTVGYTDDGTGFTSGKKTLVARGLPGFIQMGDVREHFTGNGQQKFMTAPIRTMTLITTLPTTITLTNLIVEDAYGFSGNIHSYSYSATGRSVKIVAQEMAAPKK